MNGIVPSVKPLSTVYSLTVFLYFTKGLYVFEGFKVLRPMPGVAALLTSFTMLQGLYRSFHHVIMHYFLLDLIVFKIQHGFNS